MGRATFRPEGAVVEGQAMIRVLLVDDHPAWRSFVMAHVRPHAIEIVGTASDGVEAIQSARLLKPDVILMDVWIPRLSGLQVTRVICDSDPDARVLVVTNESDPMAVEVALGAGAL